MNPAAQNMNNFISMLLNSRYMDMMNEYLVNRGTFLGSTWIDHDPGTARTYSEDDMAALLVHWLDDGVVPEVPANDDTAHLYMIYTSPEITLTLGGSSTGFCAYHYWGHHNTNILQKANMFFGVMTATVGTDAVAHELAEACTDRSGNAWYTSDGKGAEIGDVCGGCGMGDLTLNGFQVDSYWLVSENRCLQQTDLTPPPPLATMKVVLNPASFPLNKSTTFTITTTDATSGAAIGQTTATINNYGITGNGPIPQPVPGQGSPLTATTIFRAGKEIVFDGNGHPHPVFDLAPTISVQAEGYQSVKTMPDFPNLP